MIFPRFNSGVQAIYKHSYCYIYPGDPRADFYVQNKVGISHKFHEEMRVWMYQYNQAVNICSNLSGERNFALGSAGVDFT